MLARLLRERLGDTEVRFYHAGLERAEKKAVEEWFLALRARDPLLAPAPTAWAWTRRNIRSVIHYRGRRPRSKPICRRPGARRQGRLVLPRRAALGTATTEERLSAGEGRAPALALPRPPRLCVRRRRAAGAMASSTSWARRARAARPARAAIAAKGREGGPREGEAEIARLRRGQRAALHARRGAGLLRGERPAAEGRRAARSGEPWPGGRRRTPPGRWKRPYARG